MLALKEIKALFLNNPFAKRFTLKVLLSTSKALDDDLEMYSLSS